MILALAALCLPQAGAAQPPRQEWEIHGAVVDLAGQPVPRAGLEVGAALAYADDDGAFALHAVVAPGAVVSVNLSAPGHRSRAVRRSLQGAGRVQRDLLLVLPRLEPVSGYVLNRRGQPIQGVEVRLESPALGAAHAAAASDAAGAFHVPDATAGPWRVSVSSAGQHAGLVVPALVQGGEQDVLLFAYTRPRETGRLLLRVRDMHDQPVAAAYPVLALPERVDLPLLAGMRAPLYSTQPGAAGSFELRAPLGDWIVTLREPLAGLRTPALRVSLTADQPRLQRTLTLLPGDESAHDLRLRMEDGEPYAGGTLLLRARTPAELPGAQRFPFVGFVEPTGDVVRLPLPRGPLEVEAGGLGAHCLCSIEVLEGRAPWLDVSLAASVQLAPSGSPLGTDALLRLWRSGAERAPSWIRMPSKDTPWPSMSLEPGKWFWRLEHHAPKQRFTRGLPAAVMTGAFELTEVRDVQQLPFHIQRPLPID